jgi:DNA-binding CsgD family transcriptional regulator
LSETSHTTRQLSPDGTAILGKAISCAGTPEGPDAITAFVGEVVPNNVTAVFAWQAGRRPRHVHENYDARRKQVANQIYMKGAYLLDPFFVASQDIAADCVLRLRDVQADKFRQSEYYRSYYVSTGLIDEISFYAKCENDAFLAVSIGRYRGAPKFSQRDFGRACFFLPVVAALVRRQWLGEVEGDPAGRHQTTNDAVLPLPRLLEQQPFAVLTVREREIVALMLRGHSSKSIAGAVAISVGTVKNHRKNIYRKLAVHSQSELFARFLDVIG